MRLYGWGFCSLEENCGPAFIGALEAALPYMAGLGKICPPMKEVWGGTECWGPESNPDLRWCAVINSECQEGKELQRSWGKIRLEAAQSASYLGDELPEVFSATVMGLGDGSVNGSTRSRIVKSRENMRAKVLDKVLLEVSSGINHRQCRSR